MNTGLLAGHVLMLYFRDKMNCGYVLHCTVLCVVCNVNSTVQCSTVQCTVWNTVQYSVIQCSIILCNIVQSFCVVSLQFWAQLNVQYCTVQVTVQYTYVQAQTQYSRVQHNWAVP